MRGHIAIITETESTLQFDDVKVVPGLYPLLRAVQRSHMQSRKWSRRRPGNEATNLPGLPLPYLHTVSDQILEAGTAWA